MLNISPACPVGHPYLQRKGIPALGDIRQGRDGALLVPVLSASGAVQTLQRIFPDGEKRFLTGGKTQGGCFLIPGKPEKPLAVCEGYATGASVHLALESTVYVAFSANNLPQVAAITREKSPDKAIIICADNDEAGPSKGREAAQVAQARLVIPVFKSGNGTDFNDLHQSEGLEEVRRQLEAPEPPTPSGQPPLVALDMDHFLSMRLPERGLFSPFE